MHPDSEEYGTPDFFFFLKFRYGDGEQLLDHGFLKEIL